MAVEDDLHVTGPLELLEDDLVHPGAGLDEGGGDDRQAAAFLEVARRAEEAFRFVERVGIDAAREDLARMGHDGVVGAGQPRDRVEQDHHVPLVLDQSLRLLDHHLGHLRVAVGGLVEGRRDHLRVDVFLHVGHLFGPLVDQQHDEMDVGRVLGNRVGDLLEQDRLTGLGRRRDESSLSLTGGRDKVDDPVRDVPVVALQPDALFGIARPQVVEADSVLRFLRVLAVDLLDLQQGQVALALLRRPDLAEHRVARPQVEPLDLRR